MKFILKSIYSEIGIKYLKNGIYIIRTMFIKNQFNQEKTIFIKNKFLYSFYRSFNVNFFTKEFFRNMFIIYPATVVC